MKSCWVIVNPVSGKGQGGQAVSVIEARWGRRCQQLVLLTTEKKGDAEQFACQAACEGADAVICWGGDGTIREAATGLMRSGRPIPLGILPGGTVNDLARSLGIPRDLEGSLAVIEAGMVQPIDIGKANDEYFVSLLAAGPIPDAVREANPQTKKKWGAWAYFFNSSRYALQRKELEVRLHTEETMVEKPSSLIVVSLLNSVAGFEKFFPEAAIYDGMLRVRVFPVFGILGAGWYSLLLKLGLIQYVSSVFFHQFRKGRLGIVTKNPVKITLDGDLGPNLPLEVTVIPAALPVFTAKRH